MKPVEPILVAERFAPLHAELVALLRGLAPEDWERPTAAPLWRVRDVAAHLLDGELRTCWTASCAPSRSAATA